MIFDLIAPTIEKPYAVDQNRSNKLFRFLAIVLLLLMLILAVEFYHDRESINNCVIFEKDVCVELY